MKRKLELNEIEEILGEIKTYNKFPKEINDGFLDNIKGDLRNNLEKIEIYPNLIGELKNTIRKEYFKTIVSPGESVGIIVGQSLGEKQTQSTLNSFHSAGLTIKTVVTGVPRFTELMSASKDPKGVVGELFLNKNFTNSIDVRKYVGNSIVGIYMKDIIKEYKFVDSPKCKLWYKLYSKINRESIDLSEKMLHVKLDKKIFYKYKIDMKDIKKSIENEYKDLQVVYSPINLLEVDIFIKDSKKVNLYQDKIQYISENNKWFIYTEDVLIPNLNVILICGVAGIKDYIITKKGEFYHVETEGVNLKKLITNNRLEFSKCLSNNMWDIYDLLGVEAARRFLIEEFGKVLNSDGTFINLQHIQLLVDTMTINGSISSISRHGIKGRVSPMARASFEESLDNLLKAGIFAELEKTNSVSSSIMLGKSTKMGTGCMDIIYDTEVENDNFITF